jgi:Rieske 2Fe-2S family protein
LRVATRVEFDLKCNWKFVVENLFDVYHVTTIHATSFGKYRDTVDYYTDRPGQAKLFGYYKAAPTMEGGKSLFGPMPWLADKPETFACSGFQVPNLQMFARIDGMVFHSIWPVAVDRTRLTSYIVVPKVFFGQPDFQEKGRPLRHIPEEDHRRGRDRDHFAAARREFAAVSAGRMAKLEHGVYNALNHYFDRIVPRESDAETNVARETAVAK